MIVCRVKIESQLLGNIRYILICKILVLSSETKYRKCQSSSVLATFLLLWQKHHDQLLKPTKERVQLGWWIQGSESSRAEKRPWVESLHSNPQVEGTENTGNDMNLLKPRSPPVLVTQPPLTNSSLIVRSTSGEQISKHRSLWATLVQASMFHSLAPIGRWAWLNGKCVQSSF